MKRGEVYDVNFEPVEGSEQGGIRPAIIVSNDLINGSSKVVIVVPCTTILTGKRSPLLPFFEKTDFLFHFFLGLL